MAAVWGLNMAPVAASDAIEPYQATGETEHFHYAIFNPQWLALPPGTDAKVSRVAITGVRPGAPADLVIPSQLEGHTVYGIGIDLETFADCPWVKSITIPASIGLLRPGTLNRAAGLENIHVAADHPDFSSIDGVMFDKGRTKLLAYPAGRPGVYAVPEGTTEIATAAFAHASHLSGVTFPKTLTDIGGRNGEAFLGCVSLEAMEIPDTVTNLGQSSFKECVRLKEIAIPPGVTAITFGLFWNCSALTRVTMPDDITEIGNYAFAGCGKLTLEKFPARLKSVGHSAFLDCASLKGIALPAGIGKIEDRAFHGTGIVVPE